LLRKGYIKSVDYTDYIDCLVMDINCKWLISLVFLTVQCKVIPSKNGLIASSYLQIVVDSQIIVRFQQVIATKLQGKCSHCV
jgi:hypothetical protein